MNKKRMKMIYRVMFLIVFCLLAFGVKSYVARQTSPIIADENRTTELEPGEVAVKKTAKKVEGMVNQWDITLRVEGRNYVPPPATDVVLIIDASESMSENNRMEKARNAAETFVKQIIKKGYVNRIALITYATEVTEYTFTEGDWKAKFVDYDHRDVLLNTIRQLEPVADKQKGGTFTQAALKQASELMISEDVGLNRNIVLVSDGVPTYSYTPRSPYNQKENMSKYTLLSPNTAYSAYYETVKTIPESGFDYSSVSGNGGTYRAVLGGPTTNNEALMVNHVNSSIAQATIVKNMKMTTGELLLHNLYTIGVDLDKTSAPGTDEMDVGNQAMKEIASSEDKCFSATAENLDDVLKGIAGEIVGSVKDAMIVDPMGKGFKLEGEPKITQGSIDIAKKEGSSDTVYWDTDALIKPISDDEDESVMYAELTYRISVTDEVLDVIGADGFVATNGKTTIDYIDYDEVTHRQDIKVPTVQPIIVSIEKQLFDASDEEIQTKETPFAFKIGEDSYTAKDEFSLYPTEKKENCPCLASGKKLYITGNG